ncbi:LAME_0G02564g1_1 [Lachancea meyersii CBS 8951]|uniref:LAME_0G02564g1_1 n=1 Tax=Lachancea meyersii CBS 8951 TaxID=1266667 RepID=A0A1G4K636_9SACH|nr:LAME_0G02564g1_1 [Lachancea meyersii CBS 8951]
MAQLSARLDSELRSISQKLDSIFSDEDAVSVSIESDPKLKLLDEPVLKKEAKDTQTLLARDAQLSKQLVVYRELSLVSDLVEEAKMNLQLLELENCFFSLQNIRKKLHALDLTRLPMRFEQDLKLHLDEMHANLILRCEDVMHQFWDIGARHITFVRNTTVGSDQVEVEYTQFRQFLTSCFYSEGNFQPTSWFVSSLSMSDTRETVTRKLSKIYADYIALELGQEKLKTFLFSTDVLLKIERNTTLELVSMKCTLKETLHSFGAIVHFLSQVIIVDDANIILSRLGSTLAFEVLKFFKQNSNALLAPDDGHKVLLTELNNDLKHLSNSSNGNWVYDGRELDSMLNDDSVINNLKLDKLLQSQISRIREVFRTQDWKTASFVELPRTEASKSRSEIPVTQKEEESAHESEDEWGWGHENDIPEIEEEEEHDGWDDEIELNDETELPMGDKQGSRTPSRSERRSGVLENDDWQSAWDENEGKGEEQPGSRKITKLPDLCFQVLQDFETGCDEIGRDKIQTVVDYKRNLLLTSFMAMCVCKCEDWWQLHRDIEYITLKYPDQRKIFRLRELDAHSVQTHVDNLKKTIKALMEQQFRNFQANDKAPNWGITVEFLLPYLETVAFPAIFKLQDPQMLSGFVEFVYHECFVSKVMSWRMISEKNSENLEEMIKLILTSTRHPMLDADERCKYSREKLAVIGNVLTAHLTDIMHMFSNGDFYLFSTDEIVQWIVLLFADTSLRRECIDEVRTIRQEQSENN